LISNGRSILRHLGATPQYQYDGGQQATVISIIIIIIIIVVGKTAFF
jgi:hypothetical protein